MPAQVPVVNPTMTFPPLPGQYILGITPTSSSGHLIIQQPSRDLYIVDAQSLQAVDSLWGGHGGNVTSVCCDQESVWSSAKDSTIARWDERSGSPGIEIRGEPADPSDEIIMLTLFM